MSVAQVGAHGYLYAHFFGATLCALYQSRQIALSGYEAGQRVARSRINDVVEECPQRNLRFALQSVRCIKKGESVLCLSLHCVWRTLKANGKRSRRTVGIVVYDGRDQTGREKVGGALGGILWHNIFPHNSSRGRGNGIEAKGGLHDHAQRAQRAG